jgi:hypothetical protein
MGDGEVIGRLVSEEIRRVVSEAVRRKTKMLSAADCAREILRLYPGFDETEVAEKVILSAAAAGIAVEIGETGEDDEIRRPPPAATLSRPLRNPSLQRRLDRAIQHLREAELRVEEQAGIVEHLKHLGRDTEAAERLLATYRQILDQFCHTVDRLTRETAELQSKPTTPALPRPRIKAG